MSSGAIFLIQDNGQLTEMNEQEYDSRTYSKPCSPSIPIFWPVTK